MRYVETDDALADFLEQHPAATMGQYARAQAVATLKTMALEAATAALNAAISFGLSIAFQALTTGIMSVINRYNDLREANLETMQSFEDTASAIDDYKEKIEELYKVMNDESSTTNEVYDAKSDLLDIQRELTDTYGDQAKSIDLVNGELEEEKKLLDEIERKKAEDTYNSTVSSYEDSKKKLEKEHGSGLLRTGNYSISSGLFGNFGDGDITELMKSDIAEQIKQLGFDVKFGDLVFDKKVSTKDAIEKYNELINLIEKSDDLSQENATALKEAISDNIYNLNSEEYQSWFTDVENTSWAAIRKDEKLYGKYTDIEDAINEYDEALKNGDKAGAEKQLEVITELQKKMKTMEFDDEYIKQHFVDLFDDIQNDLDKREFKIKITQKDDKFNSRFLGMGNRATSTNDYFRTMFKGYSDIDIERIRLSGGTAKEEEAYKKLTELADEYEISVDEAVDVLVELGIVFSRDAEAAKYTTTSYSAMLEEVNDLSASLSKFDDAQSKILSGSKLTSDEINELIRLYPELTSSVQRTSDGYVVSVEELQKARNSIMEKEKESLVSDIAQSRKDLSEIRQNIAINKSTIATLSALSVRTPEQNAQLNTAKSALEVYEEAEMNINRQLEQQLFLFDQLQNPFEDWVDLLDDAASKFETITDQILKMRTQMSKLGSIDPTAALDFMQNVPNWQEYLSIDGGKITFNDMDNTALAEMIKKSSGLDAVYSEISGNTDKVTAANAIFEAKLKSVKSTLGGVNTEGKTSAEILSEMQASGKYTNKQLEEAAMRMGQAENGITATGNAIEKSEDELSFLDEVLKSIIESFKSSDAVNEFNDAVADLDHALAMGWITQDQYDAGFSGALSTLKTNAADNDEEAQDLIDDGLEKEHDAKLAKMQRDFDAEKLLIDNAREDLQKSVLEYRDAYAALNEAYYAPGTTLGNTEDGKKQYAANLREIEKLSSEAYDNITSRFQSAIDFGKIIDPNIINDLADVFKGQELPDAVAQVIQKGIETGIWNATDLATIAPYLTEALLAGSDVNSEAYQNAINQQKDYIISAFEYEKTQLDNQLEAGLISSGDFIDEYTKLWEKYYKDKKEFAEEDLQTQKDILEAHKSEIQKQIDALEAYSENQTEPYQNEIDALNDVKDAYDDMMDDRIDALEEEKKAIEKKNEEQEEANDLQEKWLNLQKASMNKRLVYTGNGGWQLKRDEEEYNNAKKEYDEAKKEDATSKLDKAIDKLQEEKEARDKAIDKDIKSREDAIAKIEKPIDNLTKVLTALVAEQHNIDPQFIAQLLDSESGETAITALNKAMGFGQQQELKYGTDANNDLLTNETAQNIAKDVEKRNKTTNEAAKSIGLDLGGSSSANKTEQKAENPIISDLINQWNTFQSELAKMPANFGEDGHKGKVDYNHRTAVLHDTEGDYGTLYGTTLTYADMAKIFEQYLVEQEKQGKIINESIWDISKALWKKAEELPDGAFNMTPFKPNGETVVDLNSDNFDDEMYDYVISQLAQGIRLEDMDTFMGGDYATIDEADKAAQQMHEDNASLYDQGKDILLQLVLLGYDINKLQGAAYDGTPVNAETANKNLTDALKENTTATKGNSSATENNSTATTTNTEATKSSSDATTANTTAVTDGAVEVGKYALKGNEDDGTITKEPILDSKGNFVSNKSVKALSHSDWAKKHKVSEWAPDGKHVNENMTMEQYEQLKKGQKNKIIPASIVDIADITDAQLKQFLEAIQSNTKITPQNIAAAGFKTVDTSASDINSNVTNSPVINFTVQVEGSADEKTVDKIKNEVGNMLVDYTNYMSSSMSVAMLRQRNKP